MHEILGRYTQVELRDGRFGNYQVARQIFQDFTRLAKEHPAAFQMLAHQLCHDGDVEQALSDSCKQACRDAGLAYRGQSAGGGMVWQRPIEELRAFAKLSVVESAPGLLRRIFSAHTDLPAYKMGTPFKNPSTRVPDEVDGRYLTAVCLDWMGSDASQYPGHRLIP